MRKDQPWKWGDEEIAAFNALKNKFIAKPILAMVDTMKELWVKSDASEYVTGAVLSMKCDDDKWHPCAYLSKGMTDIERNYDVHNKEMLGIMRGDII